MSPEPPDAQDLAKRLADLEARDKILRQQMPKAQAYIGSCQDMCPEKERYKRLLYSSGLSIFEPDELTMVKEYRRAGADQEEPLPHDLRTIGALEKTMNHLVFNIMNDSRSTTSELALIWYDFLWDRLRAIRKDITQQSICDKAAIRLVECCTRFHVHSCYAMNRVRDFDVDMNKRNLNDCLQMLRQMYNDLKDTGITCAGELEFQKYDILLHLDDDPSSINVTMKTSQHKSDMKFTTQTFIAYVNNDYFTFFKLLKQADYMESCILSLYVNKMRLIGMKIIISACTSKQVAWYPVNLIIDTLGFDDLDDLKEFASSLEIDIKEKDLKYYLLLRRNLIPLIRDASIQPLRSKTLVEDKMSGRTAGDVVYESLNHEFDEEISQSLIEEPMTYTDEPMRYFEEPVRYFEEPARYFEEPMNYHEEPMNYHEEPIKYHEEPVKYLDRAMGYPEKAMRYSDEAVKYSEEPLMVTRTVCESPTIILSREGEQIEHLNILEDRIQVDAKPPRGSTPPTVGEPLNELPSGSPDSIEQSEEQLEEIRKRVADTMPAGRFKRFRYQLNLNLPVEDHNISHHNSENIKPPPCKFEIGQIEESIIDERRANENFFKLFSSFERII